jgi:predicted solute-binding protein
LGLGQIPEICVESARQLGLPEQDLRTYLEKNIDYTLDQENLQGLLRFFTISASLRITGPIKPISLAGPIEPLAVTASKLS